MVTEILTEEASNNLNMIAELLGVSREEAFERAMKWYLELPENKKLRERHKVLFVAGDTYGDGHGRYEMFLFWANYTQQEIQNAYIEAVKENPLLDELYTDESEEAKKLLVQIGFYEKDDCDYELDKNSYPDLYLHIAKTKLPNLTFTEERLSKWNAISVGSYDDYMNS